VRQVKLKLKLKDHLNLATELTYATSNPSHRGAEGGVPDLDLVIEEEGMGGDEVEIMVRCMGDILTEKDLRYNNPRLINQRGMEIISHIDLRSPRVYMDWRKLRLTKLMLGEGNLPTGATGLGEGERGMDQLRLTARRIHLRLSTQGHLLSNRSLLLIRPKSALKSRIIPVHNLKEGKLDLNPNPDKHVHHPKHRTYAILPPHPHLSILDHPAEQLLIKVLNSPKPFLPLLPDLTRRRN